MKPFNNNNIANKNTTNIAIKNNNNIYKKNIENNDKKLNVMKNKNLEGLNKINSNLILFKILNLVKDDVKYKLFRHCKKFQNKCGYALIDYQIKGLERIGFKLCNYLSGYIDKKYGPHPYYIPRDKLEQNNYGLSFKKDSLKNDFLLHLKRFKITSINNYIVNYFKKYKENKKDDSHLYIDIFCPFFELLSVQEYFSDLFTILIDIIFIEKNNIINEYISAFDKLNKLKNNYSILFKFNKINDFNFFRKCINLNKVKELTFYIKPTEDEKNPQYEDIVETKDGSKYINCIKYKCDPIKNLNDKSNLLFKEITSGKNNLFNNLLFLKLSFSPYYPGNDFHLEQNLNNFKVLRHLELRGFHLKEKTFELKINSIKIFKMIKCRGITLSENVCSNLKELFIFKSELAYRDSPYKFPNLEKLQFYYYLNDNNFKNNRDYIPIFNEYIDFNSLCKLKILNSEADDFLKLKNDTLESLTLFSSDFRNTKEKEKKIIEKIISMKSLKEVCLSLKILNDDLIDIPGENSSLQKLEIYWDIKQPDCNIFNLQKKFPNITNFSFTINPWNSFDINLRIEENKNCKINSLSLYGSHTNLKLYCSPFEKLVEFDLLMNINDNKINGIKESLPFMHKNSNVIFRSMTSFKFKVGKLDYVLLDNIIDNLKKMPNLKTLELRCETQVDKKIYDKINIILSSMKLININIRIDIWDMLMKIKDKIINFFSKDGIVIRK